ncbi:MAG TPA: TetR/AcrR family transcriptional regulator [Trebonia sp.]|jgi:TetR/AcrR family transcriptional repressor of nem operon
MAAGSARAQADAGTSARILDAAEELVQVRGFNGFSYADVSAEVGITKAALHYHFAGKADLGLALITRYGDRFAVELAEIDSASVTPAARLAAYADLYAGVLRQRRMCLCGMLAAEHQTLSQPMREAVTSFFDANETWLEKVLEEGGQDGTLRFPGAPRETARLIIACLEGAMLVARPYGDADRFRAVVASLLAGLTGLTPGSRE